MGVTSIGPNKTPTKIKKMKVLHGSATLSLQGITNQAEGSSNRG
jgi:hypothetical protein